MYNYDDRCIRQGRDGRARGRKFGPAVRRSDIRTTAHRCVLFIYTSINIHTLC